MPMMIGAMILVDPHGYVLPLIVRLRIKDVELLAKNELPIQPTFSNFCLKVRRFVSGILSFIFSTMNSRMKASPDGGTLIHLQLILATIAPSTGGPMTVPRDAIARRDPRHFGLSIIGTMSKQISSDMTGILPPPTPLNDSSSNQHTYILGFPAYCTSNYEHEHADDHSWLPFKDIRHLADEEEKDHA
jgi:hypothetical protein